MLKPRLAICLAFIFGLLLMSRRAAAQITPGSGPGAGGANSTLGNILSGATGSNNKNADRNATQHDLKSAEAGLADADPRVRVEALRKLRNVQDPQADYLLIRAMAIRIPACG